MRGIEFYAPSYRRAGRTSTQDIYPFVTYIVAESEAAEYRAQGARVETCPDSAQGNLCRVRNWIIDNKMGGNKAIVLLDDDNKGIRFWEKQVLHVFSEGHLIEFAHDMTNLCGAWGFKFWGLNCAKDKISYLEYVPFSTVNYIGGPFQAILRGNVLRYDEALPLKEDYDFTLQNQAKYGGALRVNFAHYDTAQKYLPGGCAVGRNIEREKQQFEALQKKWGSKIVGRDTRTRGYDINPRLKSPLKGY